MEKKLSKQCSKLFPSILIRARCGKDCITVSKEYSLLAYFTTDENLQFLKYLQMIDSLLQGLQQEIVQELLNLSGTNHRRIISLF